MKNKKKIFFFMISNIILFFIFLLITFLNVENFYLISNKIILKLKNRIILENSNSLTFLANNSWFIVSLCLIIIIFIGFFFSVHLWKVNYKKQRLQKANEEKLREVKERLERIISTAPVAYMLTVDGKVVEINQTMQKETSLNIGDEAHRIHVNSEHRDKIVKRIINENLVTNEIMEVWHKDNTIHRSILNATTVDYEQKLGLVIWSLDIEESEKQKDDLLTSKQEIKEIKERLEWIIGNSSVGYMLVLDGKVAEINGNLHRAIGLKKGDVLREAYHGISWLNDLEQRLKNHEEIKNEIVKLDFVNGEKHRCLVNIASFKYNDLPATVAWVVDIEQSEIQKDQLHKAWETLQTILDIMPMSVRITDSKTAKFLYTNNECLNMFGFEKAKDLYKHSLYDLMPPIQSDGCVSKEKIDVLLKTNKLITTEVEYYDNIGNIIYTRVTLCSINYYGIKSRLAIITDLARERELDRIRQNLQTVLDMLPVAVRVIDNETKLVTYVNKAAVKLFGIENPEDSIGQPSLNFLPDKQPNGLSSAELIKMTPITISPIVREVTLRKPDGELFDSLITSILIDYNGVESSLAILEDLTTEKEYKRMLANTAEKEREANSLKSKFLANMSHEIRTPMNAIIGLTEIELHSNVPSEPREVYEKINNSAKNLLTIINDILDLSKIEADRIELYNEDFELEEVLNSALLVVPPRLNGKNVEMILNSSLDLPRFLIGDKTRLWQILKNFLDNSAKFTDYGKITLSVSADYNFINNDIVTINFEIEDTGFGMDEEQLSTIFLPYHQFSNEAQQKYAGTGLGMPISKQLCEFMGGTLNISSVLGKGTKIDVSIPFKMSLNDKSQLKMIKSSLLSKIKILLIDDDPTSLEIMIRLLNNSEAICTSCSSGKEAINIINEYQNKGEYFDVVLLDYMMEELNGLETAKQIRLISSKVSEILMVTAYQRLLIKKELEHIGISGIIEKPFTPSQFINKLTTLLCLTSNDDLRSSRVNTKFSDVKALLCEDIRMNQDVAVGLLAQFGILTDVANNGKEGLELLENNKDYDLIFMDIQMPVMDGYKATSIIRNNPIYKNIPIIGLTAAAMKETVDKCFEIGMNDHLAKPIDYDILYKLLFKWLPKEKHIEGIEITKPIINSLNEALARFGNDETRYSDALFEFAQMIPDTWLDYDFALKNLDKTKNLIHKIKGSSGTLSQKEIYECSSKVETALYTNKLTKNLYNELITICNNVKHIILEQSKSVNNLKDKGSEKELMELLYNLADGLNKHDPELIEPYVNLLKNKKWSTKYEQKINQLILLIKQFEYINALKVTNNLISKGGNNDE